MKTSVILSTYNQPEWLTKTLWGYAHQELRPDEIVIADDGSADATAMAIEYARGETGLNLRHVWHEDLGFRKTSILNRAIEAATGDYLIFSDGDCIPRKDYVSVHARHAAPGRFLSSGAVRLSMPGSRAVSEVDIAIGRCFERAWASRLGGVTWAQRLKMLRPGVLPAVLDRLTTTRPTWNGNNASCWKADAVRVGGFDERMQYGGEDREFGERLVNLGIVPSQLRYRAVLLHLDHSRGYVEPDMAERNRVIRATTVAMKRVRTEHGLKAAA
ncbi:putative glycosyltransferase EpsH [Posidoniimonas polymericola]|uniref:Putative glycosyltransferase EpsH n=1 Tax=Posidoniimonas polymericola TaxID=2528002 RepID=A0A5C5YCA5_9BACT|nr:glycosyltransferase family 2 protein [Posidoniimonas polymericola]TWT72734.1 putative glycosyltransferase EpsH [Posidoniimonas polymericola]